MSTLVNTETGEIVETTYGEVRGSIDRARKAGASFFEEIVWQVERQAWTVLGYSSWDEMREAEYADMGVVVPRADRPEIATRMRRSGLTQMQIADTVGVSEATISRDLASASSGDLPDVIETARGARPTSYTKTPAPVASGEAEAGAGNTEPIAPVAPVTPPPVAPEPTPAPEPSPEVAEYIESGPTDDMQFVHNFHSAAGKAASVLTFKEHEERLVALLDDGVGVFGIGGFDTVHRLVRSAADFLDEIARQRSTKLRRIK